MQDDEIHLLDIVGKLEKFEGYLSNTEVNDPNIKIMILRLRQDILGLIPFVEVYRIIAFDEGEEKLPF